LKRELGCLLLTSSGGFLHYRIAGRSNCWSVSWELSWNRSLTSGGGILHYCVAGRSSCWSVSWEPSWNRLLTSGGGICTGERRAVSRRDRFPAQHPDPRLRHQSPQRRLGNNWSFSEF
jgi:hypothetical protein